MTLEKRPRAGHKSLMDPHAPQKTGDLQAFLLHVKENPAMYAAAVLVIVLAAVAGLVYRVANAAKAEEVSTAYAKAMETEDPALRVTELEQIPAKGTDLAGEIHYMIGEAAYKARNLEKAKAAFETVVNDHGDSAFVASALEGLGYIAEDEGQPEKALEYYQRIRTEYPDSFAAMRQPLNVGRVQEKLGNLQEARTAYLDAQQAFPESSVARNAQAELDRLKQKHPELFPAEAAQGDGTETAPEAQTPEATSNGEIKLELPGDTPTPETEAAPQAGAANVTPEPAPAAEPATTPEPAPAVPSEPAAEPAPSTEESTP